MRREGDILYDLLDSETGQWETYEKVTHFPDGIPINDTNILPYVPLYRKSGTEYFRKTSLNTRAVSAKEFGIISDGNIETNEGTDNKPMFQAAFNASVGKELYIPAGVYMLDVTDPPLLVPSNIKITLDPKAILKAKPNAENGYKIFQLFQVQNVEISGGTIIGDKYSHTGDPSAQWGHCINIDNSDNVYVHDIVLREGWGDGIYIGSATGPATNLKFVNVDCNDNRRNGCSVTWGHDVYFTRCKFRNTSGHNPQDGVDLECNNGTSNERVYFTDCSMTDNAGRGMHITSPGAGNTKVQKDIHLNNFYSANNGDSSLRIAVDISVADNISNVYVDGFTSKDNGVNDIEIYNCRNINIKKVYCEGVSGPESIGIHRGVGVSISDFEIHSDTNGVFFENIQEDIYLSDGKIAASGQGITETGVSEKFNITINDIEISTETGEGIGLTNLRNSHVSNNRLLGSGKNGIVLTSPRASTIIGNEFTNIGALDDAQYAFIEIIGGGRRNAIIGNTFQNNLTLVNAPAGIKLSSTARNNAIIGNTWNYQDSVSLGPKILDDGGSAATNCIIISDEYLYGPTASRPISGNIITGQEYFDTDLMSPVWWSGDSWVEATSHSLKQGGFIANFNTFLPGAGLWPIIATSGSIGFPGTGLGSGILLQRLDGTTVGSMAIWKDTSNDGDLWFNIGTTGTSWFGWRRFETKESASIEITGSTLNMALGTDFWKNATANLTLAISNASDGKKASASIRNTGASPITVDITSVPFPDGANNEIPAGGRAHISLHQIDGVMDASIVIYS